MEAILFCGIQASGKSTFFRERFFRTHVRISLDLLNTRNKQEKFMELCLQLHTPFVLDNTHPTRAEREALIAKARERKFKVVGYYFSSRITDSLERNSKREGDERVPDVGVRGTYAKLELPSPEEGFDELYFVELTGDGFQVMPWKNEV